MSTTPHKLYIFDWGLYPRRISIYLKEMGIPASEVEIVLVTIDANGKMGGPQIDFPIKTVPVLQTRTGQFIRQSIAILDFLDEEYGQGRTMLGKTSLERAHVRELLALVDEATSYFGWAAHKGSKMFEGLEEQSPEGARLSLQSCHKALTNLEGLIHPGAGPFLTGTEPTVADIVLTSLFQFAENFYGLDLSKSHSKLAEVYNTFQARPSAKIAQEAYPAQFKALACQFHFDPETSILVN